MSTFATVLQQIEQPQMTVRRVKVDRSITNQQVIDATGRKQYVDERVVATMPVGEGEEMDLYIFKPEPEAYDEGGDLSCDEFMRQLDLRGLKPDPRATAAMNEADPAFADDCPNASQWKDADGNYCFVTFSCGNGERSVAVFRNNYDWGHDWFLSGVRK